ncbi:N-acetylmuramoyl-L-alanine amidase family 2 [Desulfofundulus kuznetsovii DSM 6115]|uniref:N-acetylmuramoyl-L-alanine amidase family 2 n=1 Tax=Desulfofundulus kuznetsovii (strain DSM 6115 / VKM B-1805 / 17) TaxID=760568 RepID=A0AAU8PBI8_DESK7|nr:N-acetylmuramoyl-L-alanine amidase family 2 [Desulfofundulus kuznetsovii DSM 6115]
MQIAETNLAFRKTPARRSKTHFLVLHHADASRCTVYDVHQWHLNKGWAGCGYHFFVSKDGRVYRGRPIDTVGAHCPGHNASSIGICCEGNYEQEHMPPAQWRALLELVAYLKRIYPGVRVAGHRDLYPTACPGRYFPLEEIKAGRGPAGTAGTSGASGQDGVRIQVGGREFEGTLVNGQVFGPVRAICEALGRQVSWNEAGRVVMVK